MIFEKAQPLLRLFTQAHSYILQRLPKSGISMIRFFIGLCLLASVFAVPMASASPTCTTHIPQPFPGGVIGSATQTLDNLYQGTPIVQRATCLDPIGVAGFGLHQVQWVCNALTGEDCPAAT
jgi:hypothetical protein